MISLRERRQRMLQEMKHLKDPVKILNHAKESKIIKEFREFAVRGNVIDLAIGIMIGGGFNKIVTSLVNDVIMPPLGLVIGNVDFSNLFVNLGSKTYASVLEAKEAGAPTINYGIFLNTLLDFAIVAVVTFFIVRQINRWKRKEQGPPPEPTTTNCPFCLTQISKKAVRCPACTSNLSAA